MGNAGHEEGKLQLERMCVAATRGWVAGCRKMGSLEIVEFDFTSEFTNRCIIEQRVLDYNDKSE